MTHVQSAFPSAQAAEQKDGCSSLKSKFKVACKAPLPQGDLLEVFFQELNIND